MAKHGRYKIVRKVADGGMAEIFLATQIGREGFQKPVILKRIHSMIYADPQFRNMFIDEAHISMSLSHSNIVQILDLGVGNGRYFLVMEVVDGWDLGRVLQRAAAADAALPRELGLYVTAEVCRALAYAHGKMDAAGVKPLGIVHRDVSPQNILLSEQGEVKLTDFGIAKAMNKREQTGTGVVKGKIAFMSPEQALGKAIDQRSDLFAVGTILYQLMAGVRPFEAATDLEVLLRVQRADFRAAREVAVDLPTEVSAIIGRAMQLDPDQRYQSAEEMLTDIENVLRTVFRPAGQTELKRWLAGLGALDGQVPMAKAHAPAAGRMTGTGEMEGKDVELSDMQDAGEVDGQEATSLATFDGPSGEIRPRMTRQRAADAELALPVPYDNESALSGRHSPLEFPLALGDSENEQRPGRHRARRRSGMSYLFIAALLVGGAAFVGRYSGVLREKLNTFQAASSKDTPPAARSDKEQNKEKDKEKDREKPAAARPVEVPPTNPSPSSAQAGTNGAGAVERAATTRKVEEGVPAHQAPATRAPAPVHETGSKRAHGSVGKPEHFRRVDSLKNMMAPDPSLDPAPAASTSPAPAPSPETP